MRVVIFSDLHLGQGFGLGHASTEFENTRMRDAELILKRIAEEKCDALLFLGDVGPTPTPRPLALTMMQEFVCAADADLVYLLHGNHDHLPTKHGALDVIAANSRKVRVVDAPALESDARTLPVQLGFLPWSPPGQLIGGAGGKEGGNRAAASALHGIARGLAADVDPKRPSILLAHWLIAGTNMPSGQDVIGATEPLLSVPELEAGPWDVIVGGHNHEPQQIGDKTYVCGPPMRSGWGEEALTPGYMVIEFEQKMDGRATRVEYVETNDRPLVTIRFTPDNIVLGEPDTHPAVPLIEPGTHGLLEWDGAVVRLIVTCTESELERAQYALDAVHDHLIQAGADKVVQMPPEVERVREKRSDLKVDTNPAAALETWMEQQRVEEQVRGRARGEAGLILGDPDG